MTPLPTPPHSSMWHFSFTRQMALSYFTATTTAVATAVGMNMWTKVSTAGELWSQGPPEGSRVPEKTAFSAHRSLRIPEWMPGHMSLAAFNCLSSWIIRSLSTHLHMSSNNFHCSLPSTESSTLGGPMGAFCCCGCR